MMTVKAIRHHQSFAGRDVDDAHAQYLRLSNPSTQTMLGSLNLGDGTLFAGAVRPGTIIGREDEDLIIKPCDTKASHLILMGSCGENAPFAGNVYLRTAYNRDMCMSGAIFLCPGTGGTINMYSDTNVTIQSEDDMYIEVADILEICASCLRIYSDEMRISAYDLSVDIDGSMCFVATDGDIILTADEIFLDADDITIEGSLAACGDVSFIGLDICNYGYTPLLTLDNACNQVGNPGDTCKPMIDFHGFGCSVFGVCGPIWLGDSTGKDNAKYCLDGGIFINVNGCHRYIKFHRPLP